MARPQRNNVDYFPFYCEEGKKMFYLEETYGNDGFATFLKLLRELAKTDYHYLDLSKNTTKMFLSAKCKISKETLESIIKDLVDLEKFDKELWDKCTVIWCQDFIDSIQDAYAKRTNNCIDRNGLLILLTSKGVYKPIKLPPKLPKLPSDSTVNPQTILEESKEEESKKEDLFKPEFELFISACFKYLGIPYTKGDPSRHGIEAPIRRWLLTQDANVQLKNLEAYVESKPKHAFKKIETLLAGLGGYNYCQDLKKQYTPANNGQPQKTKGQLEEDQKQEDAIKEKYKTTIKEVEIARGEIGKTN